MPYIPELQLRQLLAETMAELNRLRAENIELRAQLELEDEELMMAELCEMLDEAGVDWEQTGVMSLEMH